MAATSGSKSYFRSIMSHSKPLNSSTSSGLLEQKLKNVKITVNHLTAQLKVVTDLKSLLEDGVSKTKEENERLTKVNRGLIATVQRQNERLKELNIEPNLSSLDLLDPVVNPIATVNTIQNLRRKVADLSEKLRLYQFQEDVQKGDVLVQQVQELQFALEELIEERESSKTKDSSNVDMYKRIIAELRRNLELQDKLNRGLVYKLRRRSEKTRAAPAIGSSIYSERLSKSDGDSPPKLYEEEIHNLKKENAKLVKRINELEIELGLISASTQEEDSATGRTVYDVDNEDNLLFEARMEELHYRLDASQLRVKTQEQSSLLKSGERKIKELEIANSRLTKEIEVLHSRMKPRMMDSSSSGSTYSSGVLDIRAGVGEQYAESYDLRSVGDALRQPASFRSAPLGSQASLSALARTPGIMSTNAGQRRSHSDPPVQIRARGGGAQPPVDRVQNYGRPPAQKNFSMPPTTYDCPNCNRRFPSSRVAEFQEHVDKCLG